jgi:hypothetical protein
VRLLASAAFACAAIVSTNARSQPPDVSPPSGTPAPAPSATPATPAGTPGEPPIEARAFGDLESAPPPPTSYTYLQYGVAFTAEVVSAAGPICDNTEVACILGPGGGVAVRAGWRGRGPLYLGGAYELSKCAPRGAGTS